MGYLADVLLVAGALGAGLYCYVLARRLARFNDLENGVGWAVAVLASQVDALTRALAAAQSTSTASTESLQSLTHRAEDVARRLELMVASMHDLSEEATASPPPESEPMFIRHTRPTARAAG